MHRAGMYGLLYLPMLAMHNLHSILGITFMLDHALGRENMDRRYFRVRYIEIKMAGM